MFTNPHLSLGATYLGNNSCRFGVWAPKVQRMEVHLLETADRFVPMQPLPRGYYEAVVENVPPGSLYLYRLNGEKERPDPASRYQPQGVHGASQVVDPRFDWQDQLSFGRFWCDYILYELHVGTFTPEGTFDAIVPHLDALKELGITAIELMPVAQFPGGRNWGYDGVYLFAVQNTYGGPLGLKRLVNACHQRGLAAILDVVYNHLGPEGNYLNEYGHYFTDFYRTPWGNAVNFDGPHSDEVRRFFLENALYWQREFHIDGLRLDAIHAIRDFSAQPFLADLKTVTQQQAERLGRRFYVTAESNLNDARVLRQPERNGLGMDAQWCDDFHHSLHSLLTGERGGYYIDFGQVDHLVRAYRDGFVYTGQYSEFRQCSHGNATSDLPPWQFIVSTQTHDQIGNRLFGERLSKLTDFEGLKVAAMAMLLSPFVPMLFMGEEYGETAPFAYFISHSDAGLVEAVRRGRREEFASFEWQGEVPDPQAEATFQSCKLDHSLRHQGQHRVLWGFYRELIRLRQAYASLAQLSRKQMKVLGWEKERVVVLERWCGEERTCQVFNYGESATSLTFTLRNGRWQKLLDTADPRWQGSGNSLPENLDSDGEATLTIGRHGSGLFALRAS